MTPDQIRSAVEMLDLLVIVLGRETERHYTDYACHACTALHEVALAAGSDPAFAGRWQADSPGSLAADLT